MLNYVTNVSYSSRDTASCDEERNFQPAISPTSSKFSSLSSSNFDSFSPCISSSSKMILNLNHYNNLIVNDSNSKGCRRDNQATNKDRVKEEMKRNKFKISLERHKNPSYDEESSEADSGIADSVESPTAKGKKSIWPLTSKSKKELNDSKVYEGVFQKPKSTKEIKNLRNININENFRKPLDYVVKYSKNQELSHANVLLSSATLSEDQRENRYEKKYKSAASLHHRSAAKKYHLKKSVLTPNTHEEDMDMNASNNDTKLNTYQTFNNFKVRNVSNKSIHNQQDSPYVLHATIPKNTISYVRRNLLSCPEESELDHSFSSSLNISSLQRFSSADHTRSSRSEVWRNIFKTSPKIKSSNKTSIVLEPVSNRLKSSFEHSKSSSRLKPTLLKMDVDTQQRTNGGIFNSLSRIFKRNKRKSESCLKDANNNTLPLKRVHLKNASQSSLNDLSQQSRVSRSSSKSTLNGVNVMFSNNDTQERLETESFYTGKESLTSCTITILSSKYSGASSLRQALIDFNRWNSLLFTFSSLLPPTKSLSSEDFLAKRSAFKRSAKTLVINIKNTLNNCHSVSFVDCVRLSCCISYADVVSCCSFVLDFVSLPNERKRITDNVTAVGRAFHATVSTSPTYHQVYNKNDVFNDKKSKKLFDNVQKVIENSKNLAFLIDSIRYNQLTLQF